MQDAARPWMASAIRTLEDNRQTKEEQYVKCDPGQSDVDVIRYACAARVGVTQTTSDEDIHLTIYEAAINGDVARRVPPMLQVKGGDLESRI